MRVLFVPYPRLRKVGQWCPVSKLLRSASFSTFAVTKRFSVGENLDSVDPSRAAYDKIESNPMRCPGAGQGVVLLSPALGSVAQRRRAGCVHLTSLDGATPACTACQSLRKL